MALVRRVDARDVLDANATVRRRFTGRLLGRYRRSGPNAWDDYVLDEQEGALIEVAPGTPVQVESEAAVFRMRYRGEVVVVAWLPNPGEVGRDSDPRALFLDGYVGDEDPTPEGSMGAWLHGELRPKRRAED
jgi:hypothetical protein